MISSTSRLVSRIARTSVASRAFAAQGPTRSKAGMADFDKKVSALRARVWSSRGYYLIEGGRREGGGGFHARNSNSCSHIKMPLKPCKNAACPDPACTGPPPPPQPNIIPSWRVMELRPNLDTHLFSADPRYFISFLLKYTIPRRS